MSRTALQFVAGLLLASSAFSAPIGEVVPVDGEPFRAKLVGAEPPWKLEFETPEGRRNMPAADLVRWGTFVDSSRGPQVLLADGGLLVGELHAIEHEKLLVDSDLLSRVTLPLAEVPAVLVHPPSDRHRRDQLVRRLQAAKGDTDRVLLDNGDELTGTIAALHDDVLSLESEGGKLEIELARIAAVIFNPALRKYAADKGPRALVGLSDGSRLLVHALVVGAAQAQLTLIGDVQVSAEIAAVVALQPLGGRAVYLSDLKPAGYKHIPFLQLSWPYQNDRNVAADRLRAGGKLILKGLGMHSASRLTYNLDRPYRRLDAELAIDESTAGYGSVVFRVFVDDAAGGWQPKFTSGVIRGGDPPEHMSVDVSGAKRISLLVEFADRGDERDDADWLDARLIP